MILRHLCLAALALAAPAAAKAPAMHVTGFAQAGLANAAAYVTVHNGGPAADRLVGVTTPAAQSASIHNSVLAGGITRMRPAGAQPISAGGQIAMRPGGLHVMLMGLKAPLRPGTRLPLTLRFARAGSVQVSLPVLAPGASPAGQGHHGH
ncbi:hypothetical protein GCM10022280_19490 [Sphingomonas swuensis]|uniref:Copper chaperone PCu(A)C n=1 Tax=Sphingomonas swuensis TaxID=977800 RepID=A0ABP7T1P9_9SPHN